MTINVSPHSEWAIADWSRSQLSRGLKMTGIAGTYSPPNPEQTDPGSALSLPTSSPAGLAWLSASCALRRSWGLCDWGVGHVAPRGAPEAWPLCLPSGARCSHSGAERPDKEAPFGMRTWTRLELIPEMSSSLVSGGSIELGLQFGIWCRWGCEVQKEQMIAGLTVHEENRASSITSESFLFSPSSPTPFHLWATLKRSPEVWAQLQRCWCCTDVASPLISATTEHIPVCHNPNNLCSAASCYPEQSVLEWRVAGLSQRSLSVLSGGKTELRID